MPKTETVTITLDQLPPVPAGSSFRLMKIERVGMPHPYCITPKHVAHASDHFNGILSEDAIRDAEKHGARCDICRVQEMHLSFAEHENPLTLFLAVPQNKDLNAVPGLHAYLLHVKNAGLGVEGFAFKLLDAPAPPTEPGQIIGGAPQHGMGGFLNPPGHPEHTHHVETDLKKQPQNRGGMSLSEAVDCTWLVPSTRAAAKSMLDRWQEYRPALESPEVQDWIRQVLGYFRGCYRGEGPEPECWHADKLCIPKAGEPARLNEEHAGVHLIRKYYPEYEPTGEHFSEAYWGTKPEAV